MPYNYQLTWVNHAKRWRKRYLGKTYYLKSPNNGKRDRKGYESAFREWERLKAYLDGLGPNPYTPTGAIIPEDQLPMAAPVYFPPAPPIREPHVMPLARTIRPPVAKLVPARHADDPDWIEGTGFGAMLNPELITVRGNGNPYSDERRIEALADFWLDQRKKQVDRGDLSLSQWDEDRTKLAVFRKFLRANYPTTAYIDEIDPSILNLYRDKQWEFVDSGGEHSISKVTLRKRLATVAKWLTWLVDQNILTDLPKDLRSYGRVRLDKPKPVFWSVGEIKALANHATERTRLYIMLGLNLGATQRDIATLEPSMIDWETRIVTRNRHKTGVASKARLWSVTLELLAKHRNPNESGPLLVGEGGNPLLEEKVNAKGNTIRTDAIGLAFERLKAAKKTGFKGDPRSFKHLRKSAANEIEKVRPDLTGLFLAHAEAGMKRHYVQQQFQDLFQETDKLAAVFGF